MLRTALSVAVDWELLSHVPKVRWMKGPQPEFDFVATPAVVTAHGDVASRDCGRSS